MTTTALKVLAGREDFAIGQGIVNQTRQGNVVPINQINLQWVFNTKAEITALDITTYGYATLNIGLTLVDYAYSGSSTATVDGFSVLLPNIGVGRWLLINNRTYAKDFGAVGDGSVDDTIAIQTALLSITKGTVYLPTGSFKHTGLVLPTEVTLKGEGHRATILVLADNSNTDSIVTEDFSILTGTNKWLVANDDVPQGFGLVGLSIDGNSANNATGFGLKIYGKRYIISDVQIFDTAEIGYYTECAATGGQIDERDMPEADIGPMWIRNAGTIGCQYRGPHDGRISFMAVSESGTDGLSIESLTNVYNGSLDIGFLHSYANLGVGVRSDSAFRADHIASESNDQEGLIITGATGSCQINTLFLFKNSENNDNVSYEGVLAGTDNTIGNLRCQCDFSAGGLNITGSGNQVNGGLIVGKTAVGIKGTGLNLSGNNLKISCQVKNFSGVGGVAANTNTSQSQLDLNLTNSEKLHTNTAGNRNIFNIIGNAAAGQTPFTGDARSATEIWNLLYFDTDSSITQKSANQGSATVLSGTSSIVVTHDLMFTPNIIDISITPTSNVGENFWIDTVTATQFTINTENNVVGNKTFAWQTRQ